MAGLIGGMASNASTPIGDVPAVGMGSGVGVGQGLTAPPIDTSSIGGYLGSVGQAMQVGSANTAMMLHGPQSPQNLSAMLDYREQVGAMQASAKGGMQGLLDYYDHVSPDKAVDIRTKMEDYQKSVADASSAMSGAGSAQIKMQTDAQTFLGNMYGMIAQQPAQTQQAVYQKSLGLIKQYDPNAPDTYDPQRGQIAIAQAVGASKMNDQAFQMQNEAYQQKLSMQAPQTDLAKMQLDRANAASKGDMQSFGELSQQIQDNQFESAYKRLQAGNADATTLRGEYTAQSQDYVQAKMAFGNLQNNLALNTPQGDAAAMYNFMKMIDPTMHVKPGAAAQVGDTTGVSESLIQQYNATVNGQKLSPQMKENIANSAQGMFKTYQANQSRVDQTYGSLAQKYGTDPSKVVVNPASNPSPYSPAQEAQIAQMTPQQVQQMAAQAKAAGKDPAAIAQTMQTIAGIQGTATQVNHASSIASDLKTLAPNADPNIIKAIAQNAPVLQAAGINTPQRAQAFAAQMAAESGGFSTTTESISDKQAEAQYGGRRDLGNDQPGDGAKYKGGGIIQLTGKGNYAAYGKKIGVDLVNHPELARDPAVAVKIAAAYWQDHGLNQLADKGDFTGITRAINGGLNGQKTRLAYYNKAQNLNLFSGQGQS